MPKRLDMALRVPTKSLLKMSPDTAMLFAPFGCTHPKGTNSMATSGLVFRSDLVN